jgi:hypothetical protein
MTIAIDTGSVPGGVAGEHPVAAAGTSRGGAAGAIPGHDDADWTIGAGTVSVGTVPLGGRAAIGAR